MKPVFIIAEMSANHHQSYHEAVSLIRAAKYAGADAIKIQTYTPDTITIKSDRPECKISSGTIWDGRTLYDLYNETFMPWEWQPKLKRVADEIGIELFSSPFDETAVDFLEEMGVARYKIASYEIVDLSLIRYAASKGKPMIISTGMADIQEIRDAVIASNYQTTLLKCTSAYPSLPKDMNLRTIPDMIGQFGVPVGLSDHTIDINIPAVAVALGACVIEKHFTLDRSKGGPDSSFSMEPDEFKAMVESIRIAEQSLGEALYAMNESEKSGLAFRPSLYVVENIKKGELFTDKNVRSIRPQNGLLPKYMGDVLGKKATMNIDSDTPLEWGMIE